MSSIPLASLTPRAGLILRVGIASQTVVVLQDGSPLAAFPVSTSRYGCGETEGSHQTPRGWHVVAEKIGEAQPLGTVFKGRVPTGEMWDPSMPMDLENEDADLILSRILWLDGTEPHNTNTKDRYIYFHGTNREDLIGTAASIGCIRLRNHDMLSLYDLADVGTPVCIDEYV
ncbi:MAG: L,D-transpeptidase [Candidatus Methylacidiphilales bacterium]